MTDDLATFLLRCIEDDERVAREAADEIERLDQAFEVDQQEWRRWSRPFASASASGPVATFVDAQAPARVLAECAAKKAIVEEHETIRAAYPGTTIETDPCCETCSAGGEYPGEFPCRTLRLLAQPYRDREGFREEWAP
ncbi:MAG: DUF6221 family protein [Mycobacteriaceae bacterium]